LVKNSRGTDCKDLGIIGENSCQIDDMTKYSYFNNYTETAGPDNVFTSLNLAATVILMILIMKFRQYHEITEDELDRSLFSPSDFTFMVEKIPLFENEDDIKKFFEEKTKVYQFTIKKINKAYHIGEYVGLQRKRDQFQKRLEKLLFSNETKNARTIEILKNQIATLKEKIDDVQKGFENMEAKFSGVAFITVNSEKGAILIYSFL
jgi:hypothetical protein